MLHYSGKGLDLYSVFNDLGIGRVKDSGSVFKHSNSKHFSKYGCKALAVVSKSCVAIIT